MKANERHKLKSNELAGWLGRGREFVGSYGRFIVGGLVLVLVVAGLIVFLGYRRQAARLQAWNELNAAAQVVGSAERAEQFARVAQDYSGIEPVATWALYMQGYAIEEQARRGWVGSADAMRRAGEVYERVIGERPYHPVITPLARIALANVVLSGAVPDFDRAGELLLAVQTNEQANGALQRVAHLESIKLARAEQVAFVPAPVTTEPDDGFPAIPGLDFRVPLHVPPAGPPLPVPQGENTGEPTQQP